MVKITVFYLASTCDTVIQKIYVVVSYVLQQIQDIHDIACVHYVEKQNLL